MKTSNILLLAAGLGLGYMILGKKTPELQILPVEGGGAGGMTILETGGLPSFDLTMPNITMPDIELPQITMPEFKMPEFKMPEFKLPEFKFPEWPEWPELPDLLPDIPDVMETVTDVVTDITAPGEPSGEPYATILDWTIFNPMRGMWKGMEKAGTGFGQFMFDFFASPEQKDLMAEAEAKFEKAGLEEVSTPEDMIRFQEAQDGTETPTIYDEKTGETDITYKPKVTPETFVLPTW